MSQGIRWTRFLASPAPLVLLLTTTCQHPVAMPLRFSADLPDGFPLVAARLDHGAQSVVDLRKFLEARAAVEKAHGYDFPLAGLPV